MRSKKEIKTKLDELESCSEANFSDEEVYRIEEGIKSLRWVLGLCNKGDEKTKKEIKTRLAMLENCSEANFSDEEVYRIEEGIKSLRWVLFLFNGGDDEQ